MEELKVINYAPSIIEVNFDEIKANLDKMLVDYKGLVVTQDTLFACKDAQKELASLRTNIESFRKQKKAEMSEPIKAFEDKCKALVEMIEQVEAPIKDGIKVYDDARRDEKRQVAECGISLAIEKYSLEGKFASQLTVVDKYLNLTATPKQVTEDIETRAQALKYQQDAWNDKVKVIEATIKAHGDIGLSVNDYLYNLEMGMEVSEVIEKINDTAKRIREAQEGKREAEASIPTPPVETPVNEAQVSAQRYVVTYDIIGTEAELKSVSAFLKEHGIAYNVTMQREA